MTDEATLKAVTDKLLDRKSYACEACGFATNNTTYLDEIKDLYQRVDPGCIMPAGECPRCGALIEVPDHLIPQHMLGIFAGILESHGWKTEKPQ